MKTIQSFTPGGKCRCGAKLPDVRKNETPYEFCSETCKLLAEIDRLKSIGSGDVFTRTMYLRMDKDLNILEASWEPFKQPKRKTNKAKARG